MSAQSFIVTRSGIEFSLSRPLPSMVRIEDIAWHLAFINRFCGATLRPISVAEHSLLVAEILERDAGVRDPMLLRAALLHDAHEAYTGDVATPVKAWAGDGYSMLARRVTDAIEQHFGITQAAWKHRLAIKYADRVSLATERRDLMPASVTPWAVLEGVRGVGWINLNERNGMTADDWRLAFLCRHEELAARCEVENVRVEPA